MQKHLDVFVPVATITRPDDATQYGAGDVVASSTSAATAVTFANAGGDQHGGVIRSAMLVDSVAAGTKLSADLFLFDTAPTGFGNDNEAFAPSDAQMLRCVGVIHHMRPRNRGRSYGGWLAFGLSYALLCVAALGSAFHISEDGGIVGDWLWLLASAGLIMFDRRGVTPGRAHQPMHIVRNPPRNDGGAIHHRERQQA